MNQLKYNLLLFLLLLVGQTVQAQGGLPTGEVDVVKNFEARLTEANRVEVAPELPPLDTLTRQLVYNVVTKTIEVEYLPPKIRPLAFRTEKPEEGYNGYARLGVGFPAAFYGEASYDITENEDFDFGIDIYRNTSNNNAKVENQRFSENRFGLDGTYYFEQGFAVNGRMKYTNDGVYYYGYNAINEELDTNLYSFQPETVQQRFSIFDFGGKIFNGVRTQADFDYSAGVNLYLMSDNFAARENGFDLTLDATKWFSDDALKVVLRTDFTTYKDTARQTLNNFYLMPSYTLHGDRFQVRLGAKLTSNNDNFSFFPDVEASGVLVEGILSAFVGADGGLQKNTFRNLADYNPFIRSRLRVRNSRYYEFYGGIKGNLVGAAYRAQIGYKPIDNLALFQLENPFDSIPRFAVLYDTARVTTIKGTIIIPILENFELTGTFAQNFYSLEREEKPWHLPALSINTSARYTTTDKKFSIQGDFWLENGVPFRNSEGEADNLNTLFDISLTGEYFFTENIGAFVTLNNLANNRRQRWYRYPTLGLNALFGLSARF